MKGNWIIDRWRTCRETPFLIYCDEVFTYGSLVDNIKTWEKEISSMGIEQGDCVAVIGDCSPNVIGLIWALFINQNIVVPISKDSLEKKEEYLESAEVNKVIDFSTNSELLFEEYTGSKTKDLLNQLRDEGEAGLIIFTSGTSGKSKAAVHRVSNLIQRYQEKKRDTYRTMFFLKLDHIGGMNTLFSIMLNGGTLVTSKSRTVKAICKSIEKYKVELLPTTPTFLNMLIMSKDYQNYDLTSLKLVTYGTEPMPKSTIEHMNQIFPNLKLKQTYGLTELGIFSTKSRDSHSNWMKVGGNGTNIKIVDETLWIKTETSMLGYLNAPSPFDEEGWYNTGDRVECDRDYLRILGRETDIINVGGEKVYPNEVESVLLNMPNVKEVLVTGKQSPITGQVVSAVFVLEKEEDLKALRKRVRTFCKGILAPYKIPAAVSISETSFVTSRFKKIREI